MYTSDIRHLTEMAIWQSDPDEMLRITIAATNLQDYAHGTIPLLDPVWAEERDQIESLLERQL